jgi:hypothetical protein
MGQITYTSFYKSPQQNGSSFVSGSSGGGNGGGLQMQITTVVYSGDASDMLAVLYTSPYLTKPNLQATLVEVDADDVESSGEGLTNLTKEIPIITLAHTVVSGKYVGLIVHIKKITTDLVTWEINLMIVGL